MIISDLPSISAIVGMSALSAMSALSIMSALFAIQQCSIASTELCELAEDVLKKHCAHDAY